MSRGKILPQIGSFSSPRSLFFRLIFFVGRRQGEPVFVGLGTVQFVPDKFFYSRNLEGILLARETDGGTGCAGPSCAADPVHIIFRIIGKCIVSEITRNHDGIIKVAEIIERLFLK